MSKSKVFIPVVVGAAALGAVAYAFSRQSRRAAALPRSPRGAEPALRESMRVLRGEGSAQAFALDLDGIFDANPEDALEHAVVHGDTHVPALASADDAEPPAPEDLGAYWLSRATDSERSRDESDLELEVDALANPDDDSELDEQDDGDELAANDTEFGHS
ncbi:MAG: hypothetical protein ABJB12_05065 [Pseudomonadota bacterium]